MVLTELAASTSAPVLVVSVVIIAAATFVLVLCVCGKRKTQEEPELTNVQAKRQSIAPQQNGIVQEGAPVSESVKLDIDTAVTVLNSSRGSANSTSNHSRGNSLDLNNTQQRQSGTSTGSSPRPTTLSRELPDIPRSQQAGHHDDRKCHHPDREIPLSSSRNNVASLDKNTHSHTQLTHVPGNSSIDSGSPGKVRNGLVKMEIGVVSAVKSSRPVLDSVLPAGNTESKTELDDYDHIIEKKARPRSDYDHIVIEGEKKVLVSRKDKSKSSEDDGDYTEVDAKVENIYEGVTEEEPCCMVIPDASYTSPETTKPTRVRKGSYSTIDPYNTIEPSDPPYNKIPDVEPPYNRIKDNDLPDNEPPYNKIKDDNVEKSVELFIDDIDPYDDVRDDAAGDRSSMRKPKMTRKTPPLHDPYSLVDDERNVSNQTDPYSRVMDTDIDDPYNKVLDESSEGGPTPTRTTPVNYSDNDYATVNKTGEVEYAKVNKTSIRDRHRNSGAVANSDMTAASNHSNSVGASGNIPSSPREEIVHDEYATVVKVRKMSPELTTPGGASCASSGAVDESEPVVVDSTPPEPPRGYEQEGGVDTDHYNTVAMLEGDSTSSDQLGATGKKKEPPYNKLSVRESLASMNARVASNPYEYVSEVGNLYATVDGNSGDGVVTRPKSQTTSSSNDNARESVVSEYYAEIEGASSAPAPPSLDSLHETAKHHQEEFRRKVDPRTHDIDYYNIVDTSAHSSGSHFEKSHSRTSSEQSQGQHSYHSGQGQGHFRTPSSDAMNLSFEGRATLATEEDVDLDLDGSLRRGSADSGADNPGIEPDPNYETVEEARSRNKYEEINGARPKEGLIQPHIYEEADGNKYEVVKDSPKDGGKIRAHVYEEVTVTNEARRARQRVLAQHMYEEVSDIKTKGQKGGKGQGQSQGQSADGKKPKKKEHERSSSGDQLLFGRLKKAAEGKDKGKDGKKKSDSKDGKK